MSEHWQRCFDVQTRRCVCPIENRDARVSEAAPEMLALLREAAPSGPHQHVDSMTCWFCRAKRLLARIDGD